MRIAFDEKRWEHIKEVYGKWWKGELERPIIPIIIRKEGGKGEKPKVPLLSQQTCLDLSIPISDLIEAIDYELSKNEYFGDAFPYFNMDCFGPGVLAAFLGAKPDNSTGHIWFACDEIKELKDLHFTYDENNIWFKRIKEIYKAANEYFKGQVIMGMVDLGGILDVLAIFRSTDNLLMDLYDEPEEVKRLIWEIHDLWIRYYNEINAVLKPYAKGYSDWSKIYSEIPSYVIQCDFAFMISNEMFVEFAKDELIAQTEKIPNTIYHLDGPGQLNHLDDILAIKKLNAVQWVPGAGAAPQSEWPEVYQKIHSANKGIQLWDGPHCIEVVKEQIGTTQGILHWDIIIKEEDREEIIKQLNKYNIL